MAPACDYRRPPLPVQEFRDERGEVIDYGNRWGMDGPPEYTYSVVTHPERFDPLDDVAQALLDHLVARYQVRVEQVGARERGRHEVGAREVMADDVRPVPSSSFPEQQGLRRVVRLEPAAPEAAPLAVGFARAGVLLRAGVLYETIMPGCGCDACDTSLAEAADKLERAVLAVAAGRFTERAGRRWTEYAMTHADGGGYSSRGRVSRNRRHQVRAARRRLRTVPRGWQPWPLRNAAG